jgi:predicted ATP-grasp superfamily ATP-dependent carboligase
MSFQNYIRGRPANRAVLCWQGTVLAGVTIEAIESDLEFGPTTLARLIDHPELTEVAEKIVRHQSLSGFFGFDFVIDPSNRAWFIEMNPRVTPSCHLRSGSPSLAAALFLQLTGKLAERDTRDVPKERIALFPNRISNEARSYPYFDDTPEEEPAFLEACRRSRLLRRLSRSIKFRGDADGWYDEQVSNPVIPDGTNGG